MDPYTMFNDAQNSAIGGHIATVLSALAILLVGWLIALLIAAGVRKALSSLNINTRLNSSTGHVHDIEGLSAKIVFWFIFIFALIGSLSVLNLSMVSTPFANMVNEVMTFLPRVFAALILGGVGWLVAILVRAGVTRVLGMTSMDEKLSAESGAGATTISQNLGQIAYWLILLMFLPIVLSALGLNGLLIPVQNLINDLLAFIPNLFAAAVIGVVGYFVAKIVRGIVVNVLTAMNVQGLATRSGMTTQTDLPRVAGTVVFLLILIPTLIAALDALKVEAISRPAVNMLDQIMMALPNILAAVLILAVTWFVARFVAGVVVSLLDGTGVNQLPARMGMQDMLGATRVSQVIGHLIVFFAMLFAVAEAANRLEFDQISMLISVFIAFGADVLLGAAILLVGFWLANLMGNLVQRSQHNHASWLGTLVRVLIMGLVIAMGLRAMGIADSIVNLAFGLTLGSVAVAFALAFGLGGRDAAARLLASLQDKMERESNTPSTPDQLMQAKPLDPNDPL
jgi:hypothetical protein